MVDRTRRFVITGAAGLVGQNLVTLLLEHGYSNILALDKHKANLATLQSLHPQIICVIADLALPGGWTEHLVGAEVVVQLHAQIAAKANEAFIRNNVRATEHVLSAVRQAQVPFLIHASSSVVNSVANDDYTKTKKLQDKLVMESGLRWCILRPTLMFGWFDPKHLGWLANFMERTPVFPIPGHGRYMRQPLYNRDFCRAILACIERQPVGQIYEITGPERIDYIDMIHAIREVKGLRTPIVRVPYSAFRLALQLYGAFSRRPPFTVDQLEALIAGDEFRGVDMERTFGFRPTPFKLALEQTFGHPVYSKVALDLPH
jgi:uncharacterized protein YbjT (DUF2867 family)